MIVTTLGVKESKQFKQGNSLCANGTSSSLSNRGMTTDISSHAMGKQRGLGGSVLQRWRSNDTSAFTTVNAPPASRQRAGLSHCRLAEDEIAQHLEDKAILAHIQSVIRSKHVTTDAFAAYKVHSLLVHALVEKKSQQAMEEINEIALHSVAREIPNVDVEEPSEIEVKPQYLVVGESSKMSDRLQEPQESPRTVIDFLVPDTMSSDFPVIEEPLCD